MTAVAAPASSESPLAVFLAESAAAVRARIYERGSMTGATGKELRIAPTGLSRAAAAEPAPDAGAPAAAPTEKADPVPHALWKEPQDGERRIVSSHELELALPAQSELQRTRSARLHFGVYFSSRLNATIRTYTPDLAY